MNGRPTLSELHAFVCISRHASFRIAADELGLAASSLSHMMRGLEARLGVRLLNRTTRSVALTDAGTRLITELAPLLHELDGTLGAIGNLGKRPHGRLRINAVEIAIRLLMDRIVPVFVERYPDVELDLVSEGRLVDIVAEGFDAGVRLDERVPRDMIAVPFGGPMRMLAVAAPDYLARHGSPQVPEDLADHRCIRFRMPSGKRYRWEFERHGQEWTLDVPGVITLDHTGLMMEAALKGLGIAYVPLYDELRSALTSGRLISVLDAWSPPFPGWHLYYPSHRLVPAALRAFIEVMRDGQQTHEPHGNPSGASP
jgi:DNA-binding transcriptional LysR family regulator